MRLAIGWLRLHSFFARPPSLKIPTDLNEACKKSIVTVTMFQQHTPLSILSYSLLTHHAQYKAHRQCQAHWHFAFYGDFN